MACSSVLNSIKNYRGPHGLEAAQTGYFDKHPEATCSLQFAGRFLQDVSADSLVFGNAFSAPIRQSLPWGTAAALKALVSASLALVSTGS